MMVEQIKLIFCYYPLEDPFLCLVFGTNGIYAEQLFLVFSDVLKFHKGNDQALFPIRVFLKFWCSFSS